MSEPSKAERFAEFLRRLAVQDGAASADEALEMLSATLNDVEDQLTDIPFHPDNWQSDGRMYPPQEDNAQETPRRPDVTCYRSRGHKTYLRDNGAIEIRELMGKPVFRKPGADGRQVELAD